ncbi:HpcH/HpaI aldolase/citrate lyase family protein [Sphingomonas colocasiae]|uniref:CoA ester lyase n=1 Tax=Sphingomonas colocasiae TaxID=1848973 RepID=A0ABS7PTH5_9SPHN|nr:CoA ester lyase [Sphingomonas colocasiae]MBY8824476.1 CoA ester lyase [Sphingomonas colocasiae]
MAKQSVPVPARRWSSMLFVPAHREGAILKARSAGADMTCIDLEDGVPVPAKTAARGTVAAMLADGALAGQAVRINAMGTADGLADLLMLAAAADRPLAVVLPKVDGAGTAAIAASVLADRPVALLPMIESADGVADAAPIARHPLVAGLMLGGADLASEIGAEPCWDTLAFARQAIVLACTRSGRPAYDMPFLDLGDASGLDTEASRARAFGFAGKAAIHPAQIAAIEAVFRPSAAQIAHARDAVTAFERSGGGAQRAGGLMIDAAIIRRHRMLLASVAAHEHAQPGGVSGRMASEGEAQCD